MHVRCRPHVEQLRSCTWPHFSMSKLKKLSIPFSHAINGLYFNREVVIFIFEDLLLFLEVAKHDYPDSS